MNDSHQIERAVLDMYRSYPFPQTTKAERRGWLTYQLCKYKFLGVEEGWKGRVLDVGCGTGRTMLVPKHYGAKEYVGADLSTASLYFAQRVAEEDGFDRFTPVQASVFNIPYPDDSFDLVVSWGVLHHTPDPYRGFCEMVRVCKPGGFVALYLYNPFTHWRHRIQKRRINRLAGSDIHKRFEVAHRLYGGKPVNEMSPQEIAGFFDRRCVPQESAHSYGEILEWFDQQGLEFWGTSPPLRFRDLIKYLQFMARRLEEDRGAGSSSGFERMVMRAVHLAEKLPGLGEAKPPFRRPTWLHRFFWQAVLTWHGLNPTASHASSFSGRKR